MAKLFGVKEDQLKSEFVQRNLFEKGEVVKKPNSATDSYWQRDNLAKGIYSRTVDYIVNTINKLLSYSLKVYGEGNNIGVLDAFGYENNGSAESNSFETLCVNATNEQLQFYFNQSIFKWEWEEYIQEGILTDIDPRKGETSRPTLDMILARSDQCHAILFCMSVLWLQFRSACKSKGSMRRVFIRRAEWPDRLFLTFRKKLKAKKTQAEKKTHANLRKTQANHHHQSANQ